MKFEIELKAVKPKNKKQEYFLKTILEKAKANYSENNLKDCFYELENYNKYVDSIKGIRKNNIDLPDFRQNGVDRLINNENKFLKMYQQLFKVKNQHLPKKEDLGKWVGIEIECFIEYDNENLTEDDFRDDVIRLVEQNKIKYVTVKYDGSIRSGDSDTHLEVEFTILTKIDDMTNLEKLCKLLKQLNAQVNNTCGLHIHLDQRDVISRSGRNVELSRRLMRLNQALPLLTSIVPPSRRTNSYCSTRRSRMRNRSRYMAINTEAIRRFGTFEIRLHSGTTDFNKISNWIKLCYDISRCDKIKNSSKHVITTIEQLKEKYLIEMSLEMFTYFKSRIDKFVTRIGPVNNPTLDQDCDLDNDEFEVSDLVPRSSEPIIPF